MLESLPENQQTFEILGIMGLIIFALLYFKINSRNSLIQKFLSVTWIIIGYKFYLENGLQMKSYLNMSVLIGNICISIGILLYFNFEELLVCFFENKNKIIWKTKIKEILKSLLLSQSKGMYDLNKIDYENEVSNLKSIFKSIILCLNFIPLVLNYFLRKRIASYITSLYPSPLYLATLTLFLNKYKSQNFITSNTFKVANTLCIVFIILNIVYEIYFLNSTTFLQLFLVILNVINLVVDYFDFFNSTPVLTETESTQFYRQEVLKIDYLPKGDGGLQGFENIDFYVDTLGTIANAFLVFCEKKLDLIIDESVRKIKLEPKLLKYVYPIKY